MESNNTIIDKSYKFSLRIIKLYKYLKENKNESILSKQILRCGTSIGANVNEAQSAVSKSDFINKMGISLKEVRETIYWLNLLKDTDYINTKSFSSLDKDCLEILKLITKIILTSKLSNTNTKLKTK